MNTTSLLFGIHIHQPVDNFSTAVDEAINLSYRPFFATMVKYPAFKFSVHCSGWLLNKIRLEHPLLFADMQFLTDHGSIEWLSAGYYEPILSSIPSKDRRGQIRKLNKFIEKYFHVKPKGLWLTERVWESALIPDLIACGIEYVVVDDYHFLSSGFSSSKMSGYYTTEESAEELSLFPISQSLRYALPFFNVERSIDTILAQSTSENSAAIIFDDGEKFGLWPKTHEWVYKKKWLEQFIEAVLAHKKIKTEHYSKYMQKNRSLGIAYLNNTSYFEMGEWSLKAQQSLALEALKNSKSKEYFEDMGVAFIKGGIWKNFFVKYHESNYLHKRMLYCSLVQKNLPKEMKNSLYKLQTNDVFWHGVFGGIYLPNLRDNAYKYLLEIEASKATQKIEFEILDIDKDGYDELKVLTKNLSILFSCKNGGQMIEFGSFDTLFNWQNTLMRREEAYHHKILNPPLQQEHPQSEEEIATIHSSATQENEILKEELLYDWYAKNSFIEHFSAVKFTLENFKNLSFEECGDFVNQEFILDKANFTREGGIYLDKTYPTTLQKEYSFAENKITLKSKCHTKYQKELYFAEEFNFHFAHPDKITINRKKIKDGWSEYNCSELMIEDDFTRKILKIRVNQECDIFAYILNTISQSESGFERVAQGVSILLTNSFTSQLKLKFSLEILDV